MAKAAATTHRVMGSKPTRPGVHSKTRTSRSKNAKNYKKQYRGQGR